MMEKWLRERLSICLDFEVPDDMIKYIMTLKTSEEFDSHFESLLNLKECEDHRLFLADAKRRLFSKQLPNKKSFADASPQPKKQGDSGNKAPVFANKQNDIQTEPAQTGAKKKTKFVSLYSKDGAVKGDTIMLKGRRLCDCQASQHKLVNNCLACGRIVCEQEGSGPCLFCGEIVCTNEEMALLRSGTKKGDSLMKTLKDKGGGESLKKALEQRDRLLEYDRNSEKRTTVIDDELDYFQENSVWLSDAERAKFESLREEMHDKKHAGRAKRKIKIDFAGREVEDDNAISQEYERGVLHEIEATSSAANDSSKWSNSKVAQKITPETCSADPKFEGVRPLYKLTAEGRQMSKALKISKGLEHSYNRVQDKELLEMQDMRHCLSMHQPYASLLVAGIKKHEGRVWYTEHRGRLWIAATAKEPKQEEIRAVEQFYVNYYDDPSITFPEHYPVGCLLGCVRVDDCLPQEEYRSVYPNGESESPFVFICSRPEKLPVILPIKGHHKIYQIDPKIHNAACKTLLRLKVANND